MVAVEDVAVAALEDVAVDAAVAAVGDAAVAALEDVAVDAWAGAPSCLARWRALISDALIPRDWRCG